MLTEPGVATCGHDDWLGYITEGPCGRCVRRIHKEALEGKTTTLDRIKSRKVAA